MANFIYDIPICFNLEAPIFREGDTEEIANNRQLNKETYNSYIDVSLSAKYHDLEK